MGKRDIVSEIIQVQSEHKENITILNWNVCIKIKNTPALNDIFARLKASNKLVDVFAGQEIGKSLDTGVDDELDTFFMFRKYYKTNIFDGAFYTGRLDVGSGEVVSLGGYLAQGQMISTNLNVLENDRRFFTGEYTLIEDFSMEGVNKQPRLYQRVLLEKGGKQFQIVNLHGCWNASKMGGEYSTNMVNKLINDFAKSELPTIILGDFNLLPTTKEIEEMNKHFINLNNVFKVNATRPIFNDGLDEVVVGKQVVDYIFVNDKFDLENTCLFTDENNLISDHYPMLLDLALK